jgi:hypothetical protein
MNYGRGQRLAQMLQMQQSPLVNNRAQSDGMSFGIAQNGSAINPAPRQQSSLYQPKAKSPGLMTPKGGQDRSSFDGQ